MATRRVSDEDEPVGVPQAAAALRRAAQARIVVNGGYATSHIINHFGKRRGAPPRVEKLNCHGNASGNSECCWH